MSSNPYEGLVSMLARKRPTVETQWLWGEVTQLDPLRVRYAGDAEAPDVTPLRIRHAGDAHALTVGARVLVMHQGTQATVIGPTALPASTDPPWEPLTINAPWASYSAFGEFMLRVEGKIARLTGTVHDAVGGADQPITTLPAKARPARTRIVTAMTGHGALSVYVNDEGVVYLPSAMPTASWVSLEGITFRIT